MKRFARFVSSFPFSGKLAIRPALYHVYQSTTDAERKSAYVNALFLLVTMIFLHGSIAWVSGTLAFKTSLPMLLRTYVAIFALINACVSLTQTYLAWRVTRFMFTTQPFAKRLRPAPAYSTRESASMVILTTSGGLFFLLIVVFFL